MNKSKQQQIRSMILVEYKQKSNPHEASLKIQKMFGYNFETRLSTIRLWYEQFYLGDESLEHDPFREDLMPKKRETRKRTEVVSIPTVTKSTTSSTNSPNDTQTKLLLFQLKEQVDQLYRKINAQDCCLKLVDRFLKKLNPHNYILSDSDDETQNTLVTFCKNYQFLRKKCCRKFPNQINNFYGILYSNLYSSPGDNNNKKKRKKKKISNRKRVVGRPTNTKTTKKSIRNIRNSCKNPRKLIKVKQRKRGRPKINEQKWPKLPIQVKTEEFESEDSLRCPIDGCLHISTNQKMFTIHQSTHVDHSLPITKAQEQLPATCEECGKVLKNRFRLKIHIQQMHERTDRWNCPLEGCEAGYSRKATLYRHIQIVHTKDAKLHRCTWENCSYSTHNTDMLRKHLNVHTGERPYKCVWPGCDKAFKSNSALAFHKSIHKNERQYKCHWPGCDYACNLSHNLRKHTAIHERKQLQIIDNLGTT